MRLMPYLENELVPLILKIAMPIRRSLLTATNGRIFGVIILATNLKTNMDEAFSRRFQSMIYFPMPKLEQRLQLWKIMFHALKLDEEVNLRKIAQSYELAGGSIIHVLDTAPCKAWPGRNR